MKELVFHRMFLPAIERCSSKVGFHDAVYHATFESHADRVLRLHDAMRRELGLQPDDRFGIMALRLAGKESIAAYKVPKTIDFRTEPLPVSGALKPLKRELRAPYWDAHEQ